MLYIPSEINGIIEILIKNGYEAYIVGGCVRDMLIGKVPHDFDITTSAEPDEVMRLFEKTIPTGIKHGTVTVIENGKPIEITTYRTEGSYTDCRRPDSVSFVKSLEEDLARRDFTVNAIAYNKKDGIMDFFGGQDDINACVLRTVGDPALRFKEDALRILRLFRFASVLGFTPERETLSAALKYAHLLEKISAERIASELLKTVCGENISALKPLTDTGALAFWGIPRSPDFEKLKQLKKSEKLLIFAFLYSSGADTEKTLNLLKVPNTLKRYCKDFNILLSCEIPENKFMIKKMLQKTEESTFTDYLSFIKVFLNINTSEISAMLEEIKINNEPYLISHLKINGDDLTAYGASGKKVGKILERLLTDVMKDPMLNTTAALLKKVPEYIGN